MICFVFVKFELFDKNHYCRSKDNIIKQFHLMSQSRAVTPFHLMSQSRAVTPEFSKLSVPATLVHPSQCGAAFNPTKCATRISFQLDCSHCVLPQILGPNRYPKLHLESHLTSTIDFDTEILKHLPYSHHLTSHIGGDLAALELLVPSLGPTP